MRQVLSVTMAARHHLMHSLLATLCALGLWLGTPAAHADELQPPDQVLQQISQQMFAALQQNRERLAKDPQLVYTLVEQILTPQVDFDRASRWVLGHYWRGATPEQKARFIHEFRTLLVRFYSNALVEYASGHHLDRNMISFLPFHGNAEDNDVTVRSLVQQPNGSSVAVNYQMFRDPDGWKVYDVTVEGISMVTTYRSSFAEEIRKSGLDGLISVLAERNQKLLAATAGKAS